jgi:two-component system NarL family response regulator
MNPIKILLVIEVNLIAKILAEVLEAETDMTVVGCSTNQEDGLRLIRERAVDIALISVGLPDQNALTLTRAIVDYAPTTKVLILGLADDIEDVLKYVEAGAASYVLKGSSLHDLIKTMRSTQRGEAYISARMAGAMIKRLSSLAKIFSAVDNGVVESVKLTPREREVLQCIGNGCTNQEIAALLLVEIGTVKNHVHSILDKLDVSTRNEAASYLTFIEK